MIYDRFIIDEKDVPKDPVEAMRLHNAMWNLGVRTAIANGGVALMLLSALGICTIARKRRNSDEK